MNAQRHLHTIPELPHVLVDGFKFTLDDIPQFEQRCFFLTHYHSDHYNGLRKTWRGGLIYCSRTTANLVIHVMKVNPELVRAVEIGGSISIPGATVTFLDANHCHGAAMLLFKLHGSQQHHLHTGDMRYDPRMRLYPELQDIKIDRLYLDTTYAHPKHSFPSQTEAISLIVAQCLSFFEAHGERGIILIGAYSLGKERALFAVADTLKKPIYVNPVRWQVVRHLDGAEELYRQGLLTGDETAAQIHVCDMNCAGPYWGGFRADWGKLQGTMHELNQKRRARQPPAIDFTNILAILPTGWVGTAVLHDSGQGQQVFVVPYSEHSQCSELVDFVQFIKPQTLLPTVFQDDKDREAILTLFHRHVDHVANMKSFLAKFTSSPTPGEVIDLTEEDVPSKQKEGEGEEGGEREGGDVRCKERKPWPCARCTFINVGMALTCSMCDLSRSTL